MAQEGGVQGMSAKAGLKSQLNTLNIKTLFTETH